MVVVRYGRSCRFVYVLSVYCPIIFFTGLQIDDMLRHTFGFVLVRGEREGEARKGREREKKWFVWAFVLCSLKRGKAYRTNKT